MKNETKMYLSTLMVIFLLVFLSCQIDNSVEDGDNYYPLPVYSHIDGLPVSSPDGKQIMYYHGGIRRISKYGLVEIDPDSAGLWIINRDGTDAHIFYGRVIQGDRMIGAEMESGLYLRVEPKYTRFR